MTIRFPLLAAVSLVAFGCQDRAVLIPNFDPSIDKRLSTIRADVAGLFPYPAAAEQGGELLDARAEIGYTWNQINLVQFSGQTWENVEIWINQSYAFRLDRMESRDLKRISFKLFFNQAGQHFPLDNRNTIIDSIEVRKDGVVYQLPRQIGG
jgi:hypothetical protein